MAAAVPTWLCRSKGPEGEFLRSAGIDKRWVTSSGYMSCVSPGGTYLGDQPSAKVLEEFRKLPESERTAGGVAVRDLEPAERLIPAPPAGGLVLRVHGRFLSRGARGELRYAKVEDFPLMGGGPEASRRFQKFLEPNTEYLWLTEAEWKALPPASPAQGQRVPVAPAIAERIARFHLTPRRSMTSEGHGLSKGEVKKAHLTLRVDEVTAERLLMTLEGFVHTGSAYDESKATSPNGPLGFGYETALHGLLEYDRRKNAFARFDIVAPGEVWGRWPDANGKTLFAERPGRTPFAYAFELADGSSPADRIPPGGNGAYVAERTGYFGGP